MNLLSALPLVAIIVILIIGVISTTPLGLRQRRVCMRWLFLVGMAVLLTNGMVMGYRYVVLQHTDALVLGFLNALLILILYLGTHRGPTPGQRVESATLDPRYCAYCEYDLTGNVAGRCPECGRAIPDASAPYERSDWPLFWKRWEIDHLDNWKRSLWGPVLGGVMCSGATAAFIVGLTVDHFMSPPSRRPSTILPEIVRGSFFLVLAVLLWIQVYRIIAYALGRNRRS